MRIAASATMLLRDSLRFHVNLAGDRFDELRQLGAAPGTMRRWLSPWRG